MSHVKNALKLPGDHADLNLNQKLCFGLCLMFEKAIKHNFLK